jgi:hypothetical protein
MGPEYYFLFLFFSLIWIHFIADFLLQSDEMAKNKHSSDKWLGLHSLIYCACFFLYGWKYVIINGIAHFVVDRITSRCTFKLYADGKYHWFFVVIGLDQAIHITILYATFLWLVA